MSTAKMFTRLTGEDVLMSYTGPFDGQVLSMFGKNIENHVTGNTKVNKTMFKVFIELAQNISYYSEEKEVTNTGVHVGVGTFLIQETESYYFFLLGNSVNPQDREILNDKCSRINSYNHEELRAYKRELRNLPAGDKGTGNIGLVQVALLSKNPIQFRLFDLDDKNSFYIVGVKIDKM